MLNFILGTSGVGKTEYLYNTVCKLAMNGDNKLMFIVPDQISFATEKAFLDILGPKLSRNIKVFGFSRLCDYIFEQTGNRFLSFADEGIRNVVMSVAVEQVEDKLELFSKRANKTDLNELMLNSIKEYKKCSITSKMLYEAAEKIEDITLKKKLSETALLYDTYDAILNKSYIDPLDSLSYVSRVLRTTPLFENYTIFIDSYYGFTGQEYELLSLLLIQSKDFYIALTTDNTDGNNGELFFVSDRTVKNLTRLAKQSEISVSKPIVLTENKRFNCESLIALEENVFRLNKEKSEFSDDAITVYSAKSIYDECEFVARNIRKLIVDEGYEYNDIAVILRQSDAYQSILDTALNKYDINYFMDKPQDIDTKPFIRFVTSCFNIITNGFDKEDILSLLKTDLTDIKEQQIIDFENYIYVWNINGRKFFDEFVQNPSGFSSKFSDENKEKLAQIEQTRKTIIDSLRTFYFDTKDATALEISKALIKLIGKLNCKKNLLALCDKYESEGELPLSEEQIRIYNLFIEIIDKMVLLLSDYRISAKRFSELLHINFANTDISFIPRYVDQVDVACADRSLLTDKKAVFVIGAIDTLFPHTPVESGIYSDDERNLLSKYGLNLSDSVTDLISTELYLAYKALTTASDKLFVSFYNASLNGEKSLPSSIITQLPQIFDKPLYLTSVDSTIFDSMYADKSAFDYFVSHYRSDDPDIKLLREYFESKDDYKAVIDAIDNTVSGCGIRIKDKNVVKKVFSDTLTLSSSQIDMYHKCRFSYFCSYGLGINKRKQAKMDSLEYGKLVHFILESFLRNRIGNSNNTVDFSIIRADEIENEVTKLLDDYIQDNFGGIADKSARFMYLYLRIKNTAVKLITRLVDEYSQSKFQPADIELDIGKDIPNYELKVNDDITVKVTGKVDRVDIMEENGKKYIRIIDYKTGTKKFSLYDVLYGINLQMFIYMSAIRANGTNRYNCNDLIPAGVLYMPAIDAVENASSMSELDDAQKKAIRKMRLHGIILDDFDSVIGMECEGKGYYIPITHNKEKLTGKKDSLASLEQLGLLFNHVDRLLKEMALTLTDGDICAIPAKNAHDACEYCDYHAVCGYMETDLCNKLEKHSKDAVYEILSEKEAAENE